MTTPTDEQLVLMTEGIVGVSDEGISTMDVTENEHRDTLVQFVSQDEAPEYLAQWARETLVLRTIVADLTKDDLLPTWVKQRIAETLGRALA